MSDEIEIEGGFFGDSGLDVANVPDDPFGFGQQHWPLVVTEVGPPKVTSNGDKLGIMVKFAVDHPRYQGTQVGKSLGTGNWFQIPVPEKLQGQIPWDIANNPKDLEAAVKLRKFFMALGFAKDELSSVNGPKMVGRRCMAKIFPRENEMGFWQFNLNAFKTVGENDGDGGWNEIQNSPAHNGGKSAEDLLKEELESN